MINFDIDIAQSMHMESKLHDEELGKLGHKLLTLRNELMEATSRRMESETKLQELDILVDQLLSLNDSLVCQLSGDTSKRRISNTSEARGRSSSRSRGSKRGKSSRSKISAAHAMQSTISADAKVAPRMIVPVPSSAATNNQMNNNTRITNNVDIESLHRLHDMYRTAAQRLSSTLRDESPEKYERKNAQSVSRSKDTMDVMESKSASASRTFERSSLTRNEGTNTTDAMLLASQDIRDRGSVRLSSPRTSAQFRSVHENTVTEKAQSNSTKSPNQLSSSPADLRTVIMSLEEEFDALNEQYHRLLDSVKSEGDPVLEARRAEELVTVIKKLHRKGEQLRSLKSPTKT